MNEFQVPDRFWELLDEAVAGSASIETLDELEALLASDPNLRRLYLEHVQLYVDVRAYGRQGRAQETLQAHMADSAQKAVGAVGSPPRHKPALSGEQRPTAARRFAALPGPLRSAAEVVFHPMSLVTLFSFLSGGVIAYHLSQRPRPVAHSGPVAPAAEQPEQTVDNPPAALGRTIAKLARTSAAVWRTADQHTPATLADGAPLRAGQQLNLERGLVEVAFDTGATVILQGPADLVVGGKESGVRGQESEGRSQGSGVRGQESGVRGEASEGDGDNACSLTLGKLVAQVPSSAHGFTVHTPALTIVDLGTEFGVTVRASDPPPPASSLQPPASFATEVHVLQGEVSVQPATLAQAPQSEIRNSQSEILKAGEAIISGSAGKSPHRIPAEATRFVREMPAAAAGDGLAGVAAKPGAEEPGASPSAPGLIPGDILAVTRHTHKLLKIDPRTGKQTLLYENKSNPLAGHWMCVLADGQGDVWVGGQGESQPGGALLKFDPRTGTMKLFASGGALTAGNFHALAASPDGTLFGTLEDADDQIVRIDPRSGAVSKLVSWGNNLWGIAVDQNGRDLIAVSDYLGEVVQVRDGSIVPWTEKSGAEGCRGVVVRPDGRVFVSATKEQRCRILEVDRATHRVTEIVSIPQEPNHDFSMLAVEADGRLIVSETGEQSRIYRIDVDAKTIVPVATGGELEEVCGITVVPAGPEQKKPFEEHGN